MTFAEFRKQTREIAAKLAERDGDDGQRCTCCKMEVWDDEDGTARVEWGVFDHKQRKHHIANDAEAALTAYRNTLTLDPETVIAGAGGPGIEDDDATP
jgi:hypothetical protein